MTNIALSAKNATQAAMNTDMKPKPSPHGTAEQTSMVARMS
jgi:hypothetical protein